MEATALWRRPPCGGISLAAVSVLSSAADPAGLQCSRDPVVRRSSHRGHLRRRGDAGGSETVSSCRLACCPTALCGSRAMPTTLKSPTTTESTATGSGAGKPAARRLPRRLPPTHPGEMLLEGVSEAVGHLAGGVRATAWVFSYPRLRGVIRARSIVTAEMALRLARVTGMTAEFWLGLQQDWDLWHASRSAKAGAIESLEPLPASPCAVAAGGSPLGTRPTCAALGGRAVPLVSRRGGGTVRLCTLPAPTPGSVR